MASQADFKDRQFLAVIGDEVRQFRTSTDWSETHLTANDADDF